MRHLLDVYIIRNLSNRAPFAVVKLINPTRSAIRAQGDGVDGLPIRDLALTRRSWMP